MGCSFVKFRLMEHRDLGPLLTLETKFVFFFFIKFRLKRQRPIKGAKKKNERTVKNREYSKF